MADPAEINIVADRQVPYYEHYSFLEQDWTGSTFKAQLRATKDTTTSPLIDFTPGVVLDYAGTAAVSAHVTAGRLAGTGADNIYTLTNPTTGVLYVAGDSLTLSWLRFALDVASIAFVPFPEELGDDAVVYYDIIRTPPSTSAEIIMRGTLTVRAGVTVP